MLEPQVLESYIRVSDWGHEERGRNEPRMCSRCGDEAAVTLCEPCFLEIARLVTAQREEKPAEEETVTRPTRSFVQWALVVLLSIGALELGMLLLNAVQR